MALAVVNKINQFDKAIASLQEQFDTFKLSIEPRFKNIEREIRRLNEKLAELGNTVDACFTDISDSASEEVMSESIPASLDEFTYDSDGTILVSANRKDEMESRGYVMVGTMTKDSQTLLKMRQ